MKASYLPTAALATVCLGLTAITSKAVEPPALKATAFDTNHNGKISKEEQDVYLLHLRNETFRDYDTDKDGAISRSEAEKLVLKANVEATRIKGEEREGVNHVARQKKIDPDVPMEPSAFDQLIAKQDEAKYKAGWFRMRAKVSDFPTEAKNRETLLKVPAATFSYARDYEKDSDTWSAIGAIGGYWPKSDIAQGIGLSQMGLSVGAEFNRVDTNAAKKADADSIVFKVMGSGVGRPGLKAIPSYELAAGVDYATNTDFEGGLLGLNVDFVPIWDNNFFGSVESVLGHGHDASRTPALALRNIYHLEAGGVVDDFSSAVAKKGDYLRIGSQLDATFWPMGTGSRLSLTASYAYYAGLLGRDEDYTNFRAGAEWRLDELGQFVIKAEYLDGMTPLLLEDQRTFLLSLGVRF